MAPELSVVLAAIGLPFLAAAVVLPLHRFVGERTGYLAALVALTSFGLVASQLGSHGTVSRPWVPGLDIAVRFTVDGWALLFALLASGIGVCIFTYSAVYMQGEESHGRYYATLLAFMGSILGVAFAADLVVLFLFWELTSVCSFVLIGHHTRDGASQYSARMAMVVTVGGGLCLLVAIVLLAIAAAQDSALGTLTFDLSAMLANESGMETALREGNLFVPVLGLLAIAAAAKSAQVPLHFWLPNAMVAPTPVSAFLHSATMVKVGVYVVGRFRPMLLSELWFLLFGTVGLLTMTVGALLAVRADDIKRLLAYSTASHLGLMIAGFGFRSAAGPEAGTFHLLNHALFKAALFLVAGIIAHEVGTRHLPNLSGLWRDLPVTAAITGVAALSMAGIPPFNGFYSKELLFEATWEAATHAGGLAWLYPATAVFASICTVVYSLRFLSMFFGERPESLSVGHRPGTSLVAPPAALAGIALVVSLAPSLALDLVVDDALTATAIDARHVHASLPTHLSGPVGMSAVTILLGVAAYPYADTLGEVIGYGSTFDPLRPTWWYDRSIDGIETSGAWATPRIHNGVLRTYAGWALAGATAIGLLGYVTTVGDLGIELSVDVPMAMALVLVVAVVAAVAVTIADSHIAGVLTLSILGFMIAIFYILASAPDLALTQLVVETLLLVLFLLIIEELPAYYGDIPRLVAARDALLSLTVGALAFLSVVLVAPGPEAPLSGTARYYVREAVPSGGGHNVVNVVLTDFRAFDTLGEIVVVAMAGISVIVLLTMRRRGETQ